MPDPINAAAIPGAELRPDMADIGATEMSGIGASVATQAATVVTTWQGLAAHYEAPEDTTLFGVMDPVKANGETFKTNVDKVSAALHTYAAEVEPIKAELARIKADAENFLVDIAGGVEKTTYSRAGAIKSTVEWHEDQDSVDANNALIGRVNAQMVLLWAAERKCANAIYDIIGFPHIEAATDANPNGYGVDAIPEGAETPWGKTVERTESCGEKTVGAVKSFVWDGVIVGGIWGTVVGLGSLTLGYNPATGEWFSGDAYGAAWSNLGMLAVGLATAGVAPAIVIQNMPDGPVKDFLLKGQQTLVNAGKGLIAWDKWSEDPAAAAGESLFNVASIIIPVGAATAPVRTSASTAAAAIRTTAKVLDVVDPASVVLKGAGKAVKFAMPAVSDALKALDFGGGGTKIDIPDLGTGPKIEIPVVDRPSMTVDTPRVDGDVEVPVRTPDQPVTVPVREPELAGVGGRGGGDGVTVTGGSGGTGGGVDVPTGGSAGSGGSGADVPSSGSGGGDGGPPHGGDTGTPSGGTPDHPSGSSLPDADAGPGFVRDESVRGGAVDPDYGQPTGNGGTLDPAYAPPPLDQVAPEVKPLVTDPTAPFGRGDDGHAYTQAEWEDRYLGADNRPIYPRNAGAVDGHRYDFSSAEEFTAYFGGDLDRMGGTGGDFMSFPGTPFEARGLPGSNLSSPYLHLRLTGELPPNLRIEVSEVAPAFGQPGGGLQVRVIDITDPGAPHALSIDQLRRQGVLEIVGDTSKPAGPANQLLVPEPARIEPVRLDTPYPDMAVGTTPSGLTVVRTPGIESVRLELPGGEGSIRITPSGLTVVEHPIRPVHLDNPYPDTVVRTTPSGLPYVEPAPVPGFEPHRFEPTPMTIEQVRTLSLVEGLRSAGTGLSLEAIKDGVDQLNAAREAGHAVDLDALSAEVRDALRQLPPDVLQGLIDDGVISDQATYEWPGRTR